MSVRGCIALAVLLLSVEAHAQSQTLSGRWSASTLRTTWTADSWGSACGPRPSATSEPGGIVTVTEANNELTFSGAGRNHSTASCLEPIANGRVTSHNGSARGWQTRCQSAQGDPRRSTVTTTITATDDRIDLVEVGEFTLAIGNESCRAALRRTRTFSLVERQGESRPVPPTPPELIKDENTDGKPPCSTPGPPSRVEVSPARKLLRAGEEFTFRVRVVDKAGCVLEPSVTWTKTTDTEQLALFPQGRVVVKSDAREGTVTLSASVQGHSVPVTVDVVSDARYRELLTAGTFDASGETRDAAVATVATSTLGAKATEAKTTSQKRRLVFIWTISAIASLLGLAALVLMLARRRPRRDLAGDPALPQFAPDGSLNLPGLGSSPPQPDDPVWVCPTCHEEYPAEQRFCAQDGNRLVELPAQVGLTGADGGVCPVCGHGFDPGVTRCPVHDEELVPSAVLSSRPEPSPSAGRRICPVCGTIYGPETRFCGNDGATLVPIN